MKNTNEQQNLNRMHEVKITYIRPLYDDMPVIKRSKDVSTLMRDYIDLECLDYKEFFWVLLLNNSNCVLGISEIGKGNSKGVVVNIHEIFQLALKTNATEIIICHNHPSGKLKASERDKTITKRIKEIAELFNITFIDHIIITSENYYSFLDDGML